MIKTYIITVDFGKSLSGSEIAEKYNNLLKTTETYLKEHDENIEVEFDVCNELTLDDLC